jgi:hypothetical protein
MTKGQWLYLQDLVENNMMEHEHLDTHDERSAKREVLKEIDKNIKEELA